MLLASLIPSSIHPYLRPAYQGIRSRFDRFDRMIDRRTMSDREFEELLDRLGIVTGATVFLHSSMSRITRRVPSMSPLKLIGTLQNAVGQGGTLALPTFPFLGKQFPYLQKNPRFDSRRTPSQVGLVTEVFRRLPGVTRSLHPTHPVAAWGRHATELTSSHHLGTTFGPTSPFYKLQEFGGRVIGIGTRLESYTILHVADDLPIRAKQVFAEPHQTVITHDGSDIYYDVRPLRPDASRNIGRVERELLRRGVLTYITVAGLRCSTADAGQFIRSSTQLVEEGRFL